MAETPAETARPADPVGRALFAAARAFAVAGGLLLVACALLTTASIITHALFSHQIRGEFDLVSFGTSWAVYLFLPYCQLTRGNVVVDFFFSGAGPRLKHLLDALGNLLYFAIAFLLIWRMGVGGIEIFNSGQSSAVLKVPYWLSFPLALTCLGLLAIGTLYSMCRSVREMRA